MANANALRKRAADHIKQIESEAYARGFREAMIQMRKNTENLIKELENLREAQNMFVHANIERPNRSVPVIQLVIEHIKKEPGQTGAQIVSKLRSLDPFIDERTIRTALFRLNKSEEIYKDSNGGWVMAQSELREVA